MISETVLLTGPYHRDLHQYNHDCYKCLLNCICSTFFLRHPVVRTLKRSMHLPECRRAWHDVMNQHVTATDVNSSLLPDIVDIVVVSVIFITIVVVISGPVSFSSSSSSSSRSSGSGACVCLVVVMMRSDN